MVKIIFPPPPTIAHIDCDCFFVSVERFLNPKLNGKAVCVAGPTGNRGVVTCASYEARPYGIRAGTPTFKAKAMCPHAIFIPANFEHYGPISKKLFDLIRTFTPTVEHYSIDEGYIDLSGLELLYKKSTTALAQEIQSTILKQIGIPVSIGLAPTKTLAKLGSGLNKPAGFTEINSQTLPAILANTDIKSVCGFGHKSQIRIRQFLKANTLKEFINCDPTLVKKFLGVGGLAIWHELKGIPLYKVAERKEAPKSILRSAMFPQKTGNYHFIRNWIFARAEEAFKKLDRYSLNCSGVGIFLRQNYPNKVSRCQQLPEPTHDFKVLNSTIKNLFNQIYQPNQLYRAAGVWLQELSPQKEEQLNLFSDNKQPDLTHLLNSLDNRFGKRQVHLLSSLTSAKITKIKRDRFVWGNEGWKEKN